MEIILNSESIRKNYIEVFVNKNDYFYESIDRLRQFKDGLCYEGYLWDCLKNYTRVSSLYCHAFLDNLTDDFYVMRDIHSAEKIFIEDYWKYPKEAVLKLSCKEFKTLQDRLPEDVYLFDLTYSWTVVFTHEYNEKKNKRYCFTGRVEEVL
ncbi:MAG: hypothetical protein LBT20_02230 [Clostridiales bacterium]|jgi:hypothetical protein|nr:hypothetical protein [Clostridiales bacterium]